MNFSLIEQKLGYNFANRGLLMQAFTHSSYSNENPGIEHNERLEFLGDSILGMWVSCYLFKLKPEAKEGELSAWRAQLVEASACVNYISFFDVEEHLLLGRGQHRGEGKGRLSILADLFEATVAAIYIDGGIGACDTFIQRVEPIMKEQLREPSRNWKAELQDYAQKTFGITPTYELISQEGPMHEQTFTVSCTLSETLTGTGQGSSKKEAQAAAAESLVRQIESGNS